MPTSRRRTSAWNLFFHYSAIALAVISGLVLVPIYIRFIPIDIYGAWLATGNLVAWLTIVDPGLSSVIQQRVSVAYGRRDTVEINALLSAGVLLSGMLAALVLAGGLGLSSVLVDLLKLDASVDQLLIKKAFFAAVAGTALMIFSYGISSFNLGLLASPGVGVVFVSVNLLSFLLTVVLLFKGFGLIALPIGIITRGIGLILGNSLYLFWRFAHEGWTFRFCSREMTTLLKLSSITFLGRASEVVATNMDAFVLSRYLGAEVVPAFVLTRRAQDIGRMLLERPAIAVMPAVSHLMGAGEMPKAKGVLLRLMRIILWLLGMVSAGFMLFNDDFIALWVGQNFFAGQSVNAVLAMTVFFGVLVTSLSSLCFSLGNIKKNSFASLAQSLLSVPLIMLGAKYWGFLGVALATLIAMLAVSAWYYPYAFCRLLSVSRLEISAFARDAFAVVFAATLVSFAFASIPANSWPTLMISVSAYCLGYTVLLMLISKGFRDELMSLLHGKNPMASRTEGIT